MKNNHFNYIPLNYIQLTVRAFARWVETGYRTIQIFLLKSGNGEKKIVSLQDKQKRNIKQNLY